MAGSSGETAWTKWFSGKGDIKTSLKANSPTYKTDNPQQTSGSSFNAGTPITYIDEGKYINPALVSIKGKDYRVSFNNITKPTKATTGRIDLKPQAFGVMERLYTFDDLRNTTQDNLEERADIPTLLKTYLELLLLYNSEGAIKMHGAITDDELKEAYISVPDSIIKNARNGIITDFGELLGPFAVYSYDLIGTATNNKFTVTRSSKMWFPSNPAEPLMDYGIYLTNKTLLIISAKAMAATTNVVKPKDVLKLLDRSEGRINLKMKWEKSTQYKVLKALDTNTALVGPIVAAHLLIGSSRRLQNKYPGLNADAVNNFKAQKGKDIDDTLWIDFLDGGAHVVHGNKMYDYTNDMPNLIRYACEKIITKICEQHIGKGNFNEIFADAIKNKVFYVKFTINAQGLPDWDIQIDKDFRRMDTLCLRSKYGYGKAGDKMGVQP